MDKLNKSSEICLYVRDCVDSYVADPDNKKEVMSQLSVVFNYDSDLRKKIIKMNKLTATAERIIRKTRFEYLKDLLVEINENLYKNLKF